MASASFRPFAASGTRSKISGLGGRLWVRIAVAYAALLIVVITLGAVAISFAFRSLLIEEAKAGVTLTSDEIAVVAESSNALGFYDPASALDALANKETLDHWASSTQFIQIDTPAGDTIGKSSNMGDLRLAPLRSATDRSSHFRYAVGARGEQLLVLDRVFARAGKPVAVAHIAEKLDIVAAETRRARAILIAVASIAAVIVISASFVIARSATEPIARLTAAMDDIGSERLDRRLRWRRGDEIGTLARTFDAMLDRLQDAFVRERQFISDASHELKTPLTVINANAQLIRRWGNADETVRNESLDAITEESVRLADMVSGMLMLAKADSGDSIPKEPLSLAPIIADVLTHAGERAHTKGLTLRAEIEAPGAIVLGDAMLLRQLIGNLVDNAIKFTERGEIVVGLVPAGDVDVRLEVRDTGIGIESATAERLFDRFFRGDASHSREIEGTGLGLSIVRSIARIHGGTVAAASRPGGGSVFSVQLIDEARRFTERQ